MLQFKAEIHFDDISKIIGSLLKAVKPQDFHEFMRYFLKAMREIDSSIVRYLYIEQIDLIDSKSEENIKDIPEDRRLSNTHDLQQTISPTISSNKLASEESKIAKKPAETHSQAAKSMFGDKPEADKLKKSQTTVISKTESNSKSHSQIVPQTSVVNNSPPKVNAASKASNEVTKRDSESQTVHKPTNIDVSLQVSYDFQDLMISRKSSMTQGIYNLGNTCFMNVVLQSFAHFDEFQHIVSTTPGRSNLFNSFKTLMTLLRTNYDTLEVLQDFLRYSASEGSYGNGEQRDPKEFYCFLLEKFQEELPKDLIERTWIAKRIDTYTFPKCKHSSKTITPYPFATVDGTVHWRGLLQNFFKECEQQGTFYCETCSKKTDGKLSTRFEYPDFLVVYFRTPIEITLATELMLLKYYANGKPYPVKTYRAEVIVSRTNSQRESGHYWASALEGDECVIYNDKSVGRRPNNAADAYMVFFKSFK